MSEVKKEKLKPVKITGIAEWAQVQSPDRFNNYSIKLILDEETAIAAKKQKMNVKVDDEMRPFVTFRRHAVVKKKNPETGEPEDTSIQNPKPPVMDAKKQPFTGLIGNGSKVIVAAAPFEYTNKHKTGISFDLVGVQILDLVEFVPSGLGALSGEEVFDLFDEVDGFAADSVESKDASDVTNGEDDTELDF